MMATLLALALTAQGDDYYPLREGASWTYRTHTGREFVRRVLGTEAVEGTDCRIIQSGELEKHWMALGREGVTLHRSKGLNFEKPLLLFKLPPKEGERWEGAAQSSSGAVRYTFTTAAEETVEVPAGRFKAWRIEWTMGEGEAAVSGKTWLARGVGPVKELYASGGRESGLELTRAAGVVPETYFPIAKGHRWVYKNDYDEDTDVVHEVTGLEKVGEVDCFVLEYRTHNEALKRTRTLRKEWLAAGEGGLRVHQVLRGLSTYPVEAPFFKMKDALKKDDEWTGATKGAANAPRYHSVAEEEAEVEVHAGRFKAWKVRVKVESGANHSAEGVEWYARGVGLVKFETSIRAGAETFNMVSELKQFSAGK
jgi:hypothetical protein